MPHACGQRISKAKTIFSLFSLKASGILETNKQWGDGLQQFLEMKHQLSLSDMTTVTNFMSNFHFFKRYSQALGVFGVTGTIGDEAGSDFMQKHFKVCISLSTLCIMQFIPMVAILGSVCVTNDSIVG